eukprot:m.241840 g.241840  ORF g.241840 m.241840 type:complete len:367 (-) comp19427_c0_seq1:312-1412(-)
MMSVIKLVSLSLMQAALVLHGMGNVHAGCTEKDWFRLTRSDDVQAITQCVVSRGKNVVNLRDEAGCTAIVNAAANKQRSVVLTLLEFGADVNSQCRSGNTPLAYAARMGDLDLCKALHEHGASIDFEITPEGGKTALDLAAEHGHLDVVKYLHNIEVSITDSWTGNQLMWAAATGAVEVLQRQLTKGTEDVNAQDSHGNTALHWAARMGETGVADELLRNGASTEIQTRSGWTAATQAAYHGQLEMLKRLQSARANLEAADKIGWTPTMWAAAQGHVDVLAFLKSSGADLGAHRRGWTPLLVATSEGHSAAAKYLLRQATATWQTNNAQGKSAEDIACANNHEELCHMFTRMQQTVDYEASRRSDL